MTVELREFIEARLAEDEAIATAAGDAPWQVDDFPGMECRVVGATDVVVYDEGSPTEDQARHIARHDPARVLRDVEAKRRLLAQHQAVCDEVRSPKSAEHRMNARARQFALDEVLATLALPYSDHPDYDPSWSPESVTGDS